MASGDVPTAAVAVAPQAAQGAPKIGTAPGYAQVPPQVLAAEQGRRS